MSTVCRRLEHHASLDAQAGQRLFRSFFRQAFRLAFFPLGGGGTCTARRIASSNLIGLSGFRNLALGMTENC